MAGRQRVVEMQAIVVSQFDPANADFRVEVDERACQGKSSLQGFEFE